ncbi:MAG: hypothetical protein ACXVFN_15315 [Solirubrobacteraceae bacterium]
MSTLARGAHQGVGIRIGVVQAAPTAPDSLMNNDGVLRDNNVIKLVPDQSVLKLAIGDRIRLSAAQFERLSKAFFAEIESRFL